MCMSKKSSNFGRRLGIAFLFSRSLKSCRRSYVRRSLSNVHRTFFTPESTFARCSPYYRVARVCAFFSARPFPYGVGSLRKRKRLLLSNHDISSMLAHLLPVSIRLFYASIIGIFRLIIKKDFFF